MSVQTGTITRPGRRIPYVSIVAAIVALAIGIGLGAIWSAGDDVTRSPGVVLPAVGDGPEASEVRTEVREATIGSRPIPYTPSVGADAPSEDSVNLGRELEMAKLRNEAKRS